MRTYYVYIAGNSRGTLYVGVTNDIQRRMFEHRHHLVPGFTDRYHITKLLYVEETTHVNEALEREKQIKRWRREKKITLIQQLNPGWRDLIEE